MVDVPGTSGQNNDVVLIEQFAESVLGFSSQYGVGDTSPFYSADNILGKPKKTPEYGDCPSTYATRTYGKLCNDSSSKTDTIMPQSVGKYDGQEFIDVEFSECVYPFRVCIYETYNPGSVVRIWAAANCGKWMLLWAGEPQNVGHVSRIFMPNIKLTDLPTRVLRLEFQHSHLEYYSQLDAVQLVGTRQRIFNNEHIRRANQLISQLLNLDTDNIGSQVSLPHEIQFISSAEPLENLVPRNNVVAAPSSNEDLPVENNFDWLPDECIYEIFKYLDLQSLCRCAQVSRRFNFAAEDPLLYTELNLKAYFRYPTVKALKSLEPRCMCLRKLDLSWCGDVIDMPFDLCWYFTEFIRECGSKLTHLRLNSCQFVCDIHLKVICESCRNLKELSLQNCFNLKFAFDELPQLKALERLDLYKTSVRMKPLLKILRSSKRLRHINLGSCGQITPMDKVLLTLGMHNTNIVSIDLRNAGIITEYGVKGLAGCKNLEEVDLGWCIREPIPDTALLEFAKGCPRLKKLFLGAIKCNSDDDLVQFAENCHDLEQVNLRSIGCLSLLAVSKFLTSCPKLKLLDISFCGHIQMQHVAFMRHVYPGVNIKSSYN